MLTFSATQREKREKVEDMTELPVQVRRMAGWIVWQAIMSYNIDSELPTSIDKFIYCYI